jgi:maltooligosyltrehalose trehalohydrolase
VPDPQDEATFLAAKLRFDLRTQEEHRILLDFYTELIALRKELSALAELSQDALELVSFEKEETLALLRARGDDQVFAVFNFSYAASRVEVRLPAGRWQKRLDSAESRWNGQGSDAPQVLDSSGEVQVEISSRAVCLFVKVREA